VRLKGVALESRSMMSRASAVSEIE